MECEAPSKEYPGKVRMPEAGLSAQDIATQNSEGNQPRHPNRQDTIKTALSSGEWEYPHSVPAPNCSQYDSRIASLIEESKVADVRRRYCLLPIIPVAVGACFLNSYKLEKLAAIITVAISFFSIVLWVRLTRQKKALEKEAKAEKQKKDAAIKKYQEAYCRKTEV